MAIRLYFPAELYETIKSYNYGETYKFFGVINVAKDEQTVDDLATVEKSVRLPDILVSILHKVKK